jgi:hypothetical protein
MLISNIVKSTALRELFGVKRVRRFRSKRSAGDIYLYLNPFTTFHGRPILIADTNLLSQTLKAKSAIIDKCYNIIRRIIRCYTGSPGVSLNGVAISVYTRLLFPFINIFYFFSADLGGFKQIAYHIATWLEKGSLSTLPKCTYPRVIIVINKISSKAEIEKKARKGFL